MAIQHWSGLYENTKQKTKKCTSSGSCKRRYWNCFFSLRIDELIGQKFLDFIARQRWRDSVSLVLFKRSSWVQPVADSRIQGLQVRIWSTITNSSAKRWRHPSCDCCDLSTTCHCQMAGRHWSGLYQNTKQKANKCTSLCSFKRRYWKCFCLLKTVELIGQKFLDFIARQRWRDSVLLVLFKRSSWVQPVADSRVQGLQVRIWSTITNSSR